MIRKAIICTCFLSMIACVGMAQNVKKQSAYNYLKSGKLDKAKEAIELAMEHEQTIGQAKVWFYAGNIYLQLVHANSIEDSKYKGIEPDALEKARKAYKKALELDSNVSNFELDPQAASFGYAMLAGIYFNQAADKYNEAKYEEALNDFKMSIAINDESGTKDTLSYFYGGLSAALIPEPDYKASISLFNKAYELEYKQPKVYSTLSNLYVNEKDTANALKVIVKGRSLFPDDLDIILAETNVYLIMGKGEAALKNLLIAIEKSPDNPHLYYVAATKYSEFLSEDQFSKDYEVFNSYFISSEKYYNQAVQLQPEKMEAYYNLGALYVNTASIIMKVANNLPFDDPKYPEEKKKADDLLEKAIPVLEKSHELNPNDKNTLLTLKELYARSNKTEKLKEVNAKLESLGG